MLRKNVLDSGIGYSTVIRQTYSPKRGLNVFHVRLSDTYIKILYFVLAVFNFIRTCMMSLRIVRHTITFDLPGWIEGVLSMSIIAAAAYLQM
jgi:hypothetical protein